MVASSSWRDKRVLFLCYHGISVDYEHEWNPTLYISQTVFARRMELVRKAGCSVLSLEEALSGMKSGKLPPRSVVITFDDGLFDFYQRAVPVLQSFGFPATVYLTSFYVGLQKPLFFLACSYLIWKHRGQQLAQLPFGGPLAVGPIASELDRTRVLGAISEWVARENPSAERQQEALRALAGNLRADLTGFFEKRILTLMSPAEVREVSNLGFSVQLHTHRHRTPLDQSLFAVEIQQNRECIAEWTDRTAQHFCYPGGNVDQQFFPWLQQQGVRSAVTCVPGLASSKDHLLLLPRLVDYSDMSELEFSSWLSGSGAWLRAVRHGSSWRTRSQLASAAWQTTVCAMDVQR